MVGLRLMFRRRGARERRSRASGRSRDWIRTGV